MGSVAIRSGQSRLRQAISHRSVVRSGDPPRSSAPFEFVIAEANDSIASQSPSCFIALQEEVLTVDKLAYTHDSK